MSDPNVYTLGASVAAPVLGKIFGQSSGSRKREARRERQFQAEMLDKTNTYTRENIVLGNDMDLRNQQQMFDYRINQGIEAGMTPYEMYMGPAAGGGGGTSGSGATLGNAASQQGIAASQIAQENRRTERLIEQESNEKQADRLTRLAEVAMQTQTQKDVAETQAGVTERGQDITAETAQAERELRDRIEAGRLQLGRDELNANLTRIATQNAVDLKTVEKYVNDIATSHPDFVREMKQLSMGVENMLVEYFQRHHGINLYNKESFMSLSEQKREALISEMIAISSPVYGAAAAVKDQGGQTLDDVITTLGNAPAAVWDMYKEGYGSAKQGLGNMFGGFQRQSRQVKGRRGSGARR